MITKWELNVVNKIINELLPNKEGYVTYNFITLSDGGDNIIMTRGTQRKIIDYLQNINKIHIKKLTENYVIFKPLTNSGKSNKSNKKENVIIYKNSIKFSKTEYRPYKEINSIILEYIYNQSKTASRPYKFHFHLDKMKQYVKNAFLDNHKTEDDKSIIKGLKNLTRAISAKIPLKISIMEKNNKAEIIQV